ncbi:MAG: glycosyltransferase [Ignavibacteria bacterium]|nr:glycosyltransferase [Ignavibacteria bacterium]
MLAAKRCRNKYNYNNINNIDDLPTVSVVVPARNEESVISNCINSILQSDYSADKFEIVIVNDRSTDNTQAVINQLSTANKNIKICNITTETANPNLNGKPGAIEAGIIAASGDIIMMTDADCVVGKDWIRTIASVFMEKSNVKRGIGMVCGYTNVATKTLFHCCQAAEWAYMHTYACAGIGLNTILGCFGNNISITRAAYYELGGFEHLEFSVTEDYVLLNAIFNAGYEIRYLCNKESVVETLPVKTFREYLTQRHRWSLGAIDLGWKAFLYVFSSACLWFAMILSLCIGNYYLFGLSVILRFLGDALILFPVFNILEKQNLKKGIPFSVCFYCLIELILPFTLLSKSVNWKGQKFKV